MTDRSARASQGQPPGWEHFGPVVDPSDWSGPEAVSESEWTAPFTFTVRYEVQIRGLLRRYFQVVVDEEGATENEIAEELLARLSSSESDSLVNIINADGEFDFFQQEVLGRGRLD